MAWTDPRTWVAAETVTAALLNTHLRDNMTALAEWTSYTPTVTQSGAVTKTVTYGKYRTYGGTTDVQVFLTMTGSGTGNNVITVSLPTTSITSTEMTIGAGRIVDSGVRSDAVIVQLASTTTVKFLAVEAATPADYVGKVPNFALGSGDTISFFCTYENT